MKLEVIVEISKNHNYLGNDVDLGIDSELIRIIIGLNKNNYYYSRTTDIGLNKNNNY